MVLSIRGLANWRARPIDELHQAQRLRRIAKLLGELQREISDLDERAATGNLDLEARIRLHEAALSVEKLLALARQAAEFR